MPANPGSQDLSDTFLLKCNFFQKLFLPSALALFFDKKIADRLVVC